MSRRLAVMARRSRKAVAAQHDAEHDAWLDKIRATREDAELRRTFANRFKEVTHD